MPKILGFFSIVCSPPISTFFPYTTLFRSYFLANFFDRVLSDRSASSTTSSGCVSPRRTSASPNASHPELVVLEARSEEHTSELQSHVNLVCRLLLEKKKNYVIIISKV